MPILVEHCDLPVVVLPSAVLAELRFFPIGHVQSPSRIRHREHRLSAVIIECGIQENNGSHRKARHYTPLNDHALSQRESRSADRTRNIQMSARATSVQRSFLTAGDTDQSQA